MSGQDSLSDDYVSQLLVQDARSSNSKYSSYGVQTLVARRSANHAPKPNTRFLKNIIRETDNHNAALQTKENQESRARLKKLPQANGVLDPYGAGNGRLSPVEFHRAKRRRISEQEEERNIDDSHKVKPRSKRGKDRDHERYRRKGRIRHEYREDRSNEENENYERSKEPRRHHSQDHGYNDRAESPDHTMRGHGHSSRMRSRSRSPRPGRNKHRHLHKIRRRERSTSRSKSRDQRDHGGCKSNLSKHSPPSKSIDCPNRPCHERSLSPASDSDPLEAIIGPPPPSSPPKVKARGRGAFASSSVMDSHFSAQYDPSVDVQPDPEFDDDWDQALEALRDRQKWQKMGAERLKSAGFTEEEVEKWEKGGERNEEDVKWRGRGEGREWDRGKVIGDDCIETMADWGRLKGT